MKSRKRPPVREPRGISNDQAQILARLERRHGLPYSGRGLTFTQAQARIVRLSQQAPGEVRASRGSQTKAPKLPKSPLGQLSRLLPELHQALKSENRRRAAYLEREIDVLMLGQPWRIGI
jgi:hypothetical protein